MDKNSRQGPKTVLLLSCSSFLHVLQHPLLSLLDQRVSMRGLSGWMSITIANVVVNSAFQPIVVTLCYRNVFEFSDGFLQLLSFFHI